MLDFVLGLYLAGLAVRGWLRGFVRELLDLAGLVVGAAVAFRLSSPFGVLLTDRFGVSPEWGRILAGIVLFVLFGVSMTLLAHFLSKVTRLPGLTMANRVLGAVVAAAWGVVLVMVLVMVALVLPLPEGVDRALEDSTVAEAIAGPESVPRRLIEPLIGDRAMSALVAIERLSGGRRIVPAEGETIETEAVDPDSVVPDPDAADVVGRQANLDRVAEGADPMARSAALDEIARQQALEMYRSGYVARRKSDQVLGVTRSAGLRLEAAAEGTALGATERAAHNAIAEADDTALFDPRFDRVGVASVDGPLGVLVVQVYGR